MTCRRDAADSADVAGRPSSGRSRARGRFSRARCVARSLALVAPVLSGCAGAAPLLHPAHVLSPGKVSVGAGVAGQFGALKQTANDKVDKAAPFLDTVAVAPGVSPWVSARVGIEHDFEAGLTYTGRSARVDARHAFKLSPLTMSIGIGATALLPKPQDSDSFSAYGGGADIPLVFGWTSDAELYSIWFGPRVGFELLGGRAVPNEYLVGGATDRFSTLSAQHLYFGGLAGMWVGFRTFHAAIEVDAAYHLAHGRFGDTDAKARDVSITPSGALILAL